MRQKALIGLRKYQQAQRRTLPRKMKVHAAYGSAKLLHLGKRTKKNAAPALLIPSLVNPPYILDLSEKTSLAQYLAAQGHDPWLIDWGHPEPEDAALDLAGHIEQRLLPLIKTMEQPPILIGYCLGGTLALAAAQLAKATPAVATVAAPWDFSRYPADNLKTIITLWEKSKPLCEKLGYMPMEILQSGFWALDPERTIRKYAAFADMEEDSDAAQNFISVEDWANQGAPLTYGAAQELFEHLYESNKTAGGSWSVSEQIIDPTTLDCPSLSIESSVDRIVPMVSSPPLTDSYQSSLGHVGMIVSAKAPEQIWKTLSRWLSNHGG